jgi:general secretion pathway protein D
MKIEVLSQTSSVTISGVTEPVIGQRSVEQVIQLKEGEPSILGGILTKQDNNTISGTPGLGELPFFKYFFSSRNKEVQQDEIVFVLIPHIVRESIISRLNTRAIDTGTGQAIELRRDTSQQTADIDQRLNPAASPQNSGQQTSAANAASAMVQQLRNQAAPPEAPPPPGTAPNPGTTPSQPASPAAAPDQTAAGPPVSLSVVPSNGNPAVGSTFQVQVMLGNG